MTFQRYEVERYKKAGKTFKIIFNETKEGLLVTDEEKNIECNIGNFLLRFDKRDENVIENKLPEVKYWFNVYYKQKQRYIKSKEKFCYIKGENIIKAIKTRLTDKANLNCNKDVLKYLEIYIQNLLNQGIENKSYISIDNEETTAIVKEYIISFMKLIHGKEDIYIENGFEYGENREYYEQNNICSNKDIFLIEYHTNKDYKKIGYVENRMKPDENGNLIPNYYYIHLPELIKLMENQKRFVKKITSQMLNVGMRNLGVIALPEGKNISNYKTRNGKFPMNLTKLYAKKLKELAYPPEKIFVEGKEETILGVIPPEQAIQTQTILGVIPEQIPLGQTILGQATLGQTKVKVILPEQLIPSQKILGVIPEQILPEQTILGQTILRPTKVKVILPEQLIPSQKILGVIPEQILSRQMVIGQTIIKVIPPEQVISTQKILGVIPEQILLGQTILGQVILGQTKVKMIPPEQRIPSQKILGVIPEQILPEQTILGQTKVKVILPEQRIPSQKILGVIPEQILLGQTILGQATLIQFVLG